MKLDVAEIQALAQRIQDDNLSLPGMTPTELGAKLASELLTLTEQTFTVRCHHVPGALQYRVMLPSANWSTLFNLELIERKIVMSAPETLDTKERPTVSSRTQVGATVPKGSKGRRK